MTNDGITWSLLYRSGRTWDEGPAPLREAPHGARYLSAMRGAQPLATVELGVARLPRHSEWRPVFYRRGRTDEPGVEAVVFGRACEGPNGEVVSELWAIRDGRTAVNCPPEHIHRDMVRDQVAQLVEA
jgi:hypothetical protein